LLARGSRISDNREYGVDWSHFNLDRQPFRPAVDPDAYFPATSHEAALTAVAGAFARRDPVVLLDGPAGVGKTLIARKWLEHLLPDVPRVLVPSTHAEKPSELLQAILFDLAKPYQGLSEQELRLAVTGHLLDAATESGYPTVVVLDEAQHMGQPAFEELRLLGNLETRRGVAMFALLVAHPMLREALHAPVFEHFAQRMTVRAAIEPLSEAESGEYLRHQIRSAGGDGAMVFSDDAVSLIAGACRGIPRVLNRVAALALELSTEAKSEQVDVEAALEALDRLGMKAGESVDESPAGEPVLLLHPARAVDSVRSGRGKRTDSASGDEAPALRGPKHKSARKRSA
jgi:type II secretory pathway predicted ATPase ExeA